MKQLKKLFLSLLALLTSTIMYAQTEISGTVIDPTGETVIGATVMGMKVTMQDDALMVEEVVVTGYTTQRKSDLTGAVSVVSPSDLAKQNENNPIKAMQGRVPGMNISADGSPSGSATVRIRGVGTLNNNDPLYIIDGVPTKAGMHELNGNRQGGQGKNRLRCQSGRSDLRPQDGSTQCQGVRSGDVARLCERRP